MLEKAINDGQSLVISKLVPAVKDKAGAQFTKDDGAGNQVPLTPDDVPVSWETSDPAIVPLTGLAADGKSGKFISGDPSDPAHLGRSQLTARIGPYPDGSMVQFQFGLTVGFSAPGDPEFETTVEDEQPPAV